MGFIPDPTSLVPGLATPRQASPGLVPSQPQGGKILIDWSVSYGLRFRLRQVHTVGHGGAAFP